MTRVVVTGATGFVGRHLVPVLEARGCEVTLLTRDVVNAGPRAVVDLVSAAAPDAVVHLATHFLSGHQPEDIPALVRSNVEAGALVAEAAAAAQARLVSIGSAWQHVGGRAYDPVSLYAATKQALVPILEYYTAVEGLEVRTVTLFDTYGPGDLRPKLVPSLLRAARDGTVLEMSDGHQLIDLTYVDDVVRGIADVALTADGPMESVLRTWRPVSIRELVRTAEDAIGRPIPVAWDRRPVRPREMRTDWVFGSSPTGWEAEVGLTDGLRRTWTALLESEPGR